MRSAVCSGARDGPPLSSLTRAGSHGAGMGAGELAGRGHATTHAEESVVGSLLIDALAFSNDQQLAGAILVILTATIVLINFITDIILALMDPRVRQGLLG